MTQADEIPEADSFGSTATTVAMATTACASGSATAHTRYSFTAQFVAGAVMLAQRAAEIETSGKPNGRTIGEHRALVVAAVMQSAAALEAELVEILQHGPGHHLGSNGTDIHALAVLDPVAPVLERMPGVLEKYDVVLHLLGKARLEFGAQPTQDAALVIRLRNELVHYESNWKGETKAAKLLPALKGKGLALPPFVSPLANFWPQQALGAACAAWAATTAAAFLDHAYGLLGVVSVLDAHRVQGADFKDVIPARKK